MSISTLQRFTATSVIPARVINIAVDAVYLYSQPTGPFAGTGVYMMDNNVAGGSTGQGTEELHSMVTAGFGVAFNVIAIDEASGSNNTVRITGFEISDGDNIFGNFGFPTKQPSSSAYQWVGTAMTQGKCTYQIKIGVSEAGAPEQYYWWDPFLTCTD